MYSFLLFSLILLVIWALLYWKGNLKKEMLKLSLVTLFAGFTEILFVPSYWTPVTLLGDPKLGIEPFIFCFPLGGICTAIYQVLFKIKFRKNSKKIKNNSLLLIGPAVIWFFYMILKTSFMNSVLVGFFVDILIILFLRRDLFRTVLISSILFTVVYFAIFGFLIIINNEFLGMWNLKELNVIPGIGIPIEEVLWALLSGGLLGGSYKFIKGLEPVK